MILFYVRKVIQNLFCEITLDTGGMDGDVMHVTMISRENAILFIFGAYIKRDLL